MALEHRVVGGVGTCQVRGVRERSALARCGAADLLHDDGDLLRGGLCGDGSQAARVLQSLDEQQDHTGFAGPDQVLDKVEHLEVGLVASGDDAVQVEVLGKRAAEQREPDTAACDTTATGRFASRGGGGCAVHSSTTWAKVAASFAFGRKKHNLAEEQELTRRYAGLCEHYGMRASRCTPGQSQENGSIESRHDSLKTALDQALRPRGSRCFDERSAYEALVETIVARLNARIAVRLVVERATLHPLPQRRTAEYEELPARVSK